MKEEYRKESFAIRFLNQLGDVMGMSMLWLVCSLPLITIGASTAGLYAVVMREEMDGVVKPFFKGFRSSFRKATAAEGIFLLIGGILLADLSWLRGMEAEWVSLLAALIRVLMALAAATAIYTFPLIAVFEQSLRQTLKNALLIALSNLPTTLLLLAAHAIPVLLIVLNPDMFIRYALPVVTFLGAGLLAVLSGWRLKKVLAKYRV